MRSESQGMQRPSVDRWVRLVASWSGLGGAAPQPTGKCSSSSFPRELFAQVCSDCRLAAPLRTRVSEPVTRVCRAFCNQLGLARFVQAHEFFVLPYRAFVCVHSHPPP